MLPIIVKGANLLAIKTNSDVEMTNNGKLTIVRMVNESQLSRTFIINDKTCEIQSCVRACSLSKYCFHNMWTSCMFH